MEKCPTDFGKPYKEVTGDEQEALKKEMYPYCGPSVRR